VTYYLLVFDRALGRLVAEIKEFQDADLAVQERFRREASESSPDVEIVVLGAESLKDLKSTHGRYFGTSAKDALATLG
jgi:hypothetical protein